MGITTDRAGHIWVVERAGNRIDRLVVKRGYATLTSWQLPHAYSGPQEIALGADGTLWLTERASRIARFNPRTHVLREYSLSRGLQPYGIVVTGQGPTFVNENANLQGWARVLANGRVQLRVKPLPWAGSDPTLVARAHNSSYVAMPMADGFARLRQPGQVTMTVRPSTAKLKGVSQRRSLTTYRLTQLVSKVHVVTRMARRIARNGSVLYRLPPHPGRPFDVKLDPHGKQVWLSEQRVPIVAATTLKSHRVVDYTLSRPDAGLRGILVTKRFGGVRVWIAEFQANRIGVLNAP
jgi:streptogramin lyase